MASLYEKDNQYVIAFTNRKRKPVKKLKYFRKEYFEAPASYEKFPAAVIQLKNELEYRYKLPKSHELHYDPWLDDVELSNKLDDVSLFEIAADYMSYLKDRVEQGTIDSRSSVIKKYITKHGGQGLTWAKFKPESINGFVNAYKSLGTRRAYASIFTNWLEWMHKQKGYLEKVPPIDVKSKKAERVALKESRLKDYISEAEFKLVLTAVARYDTDVKTRKGSLNRKLLPDVLKIAFYQGLRRSDILNFNTAWIRDDLRHLDIGDADYHPKSGRPEETTVITDELHGVYKRLRQQYGPNARPFAFYHSHYFNDTLKTIMARYFEDFDRKINFHRIRHSCAIYWSVERLMPEQWTQKYLRHSDVDVTRIYTNYLPNKQTLKLNQIDEFGRRI